MTKETIHSPRGCLQGGVWGMTATQRTMSLWPSTSKRRVLVATSSILIRPPCVPIANISPTARCSPPPDLRRARPPVVRGVGPALAAAARGLLPPGARPQPPATCPRGRELCGREEAPRWLEARSALLSGHLFTRCSPLLHTICPPPPSPAALRYSPLLRTRSHPREPATFCHEMLLK